MRTEIIVFAVNHYDMTNDGGQKGASVRVLGDEVNSNNVYGVSITDADIDYSDIEMIKAHNLPARFKATMGMVSIKKKSGKEVAGLKLSKLEHVCGVEIKDKKSV